MSLGEHTTTANSGYYHLPLDLVFAKQSVSGEQTEPFKSHPEATPSPLVSHQDSRGQLFPGCHLRKINSYAELLTNHMVSSFWIHKDYADGNARNVQMHFARSNSHTSLLLPILAAMVSLSKYNL